VWNKVEASASSAPSLDNTVVGEQVDNAGAVEWDQYATGAGLAGDATATFELVARNAVPSALQMNPTNAGAPKGVPINFTATALDSAGVPYAGRTLRYTITGANPTSSAVTLNAGGSGVITDPGTNAGADTVVAFVDFNNNGTRQDAEPQASALATFIDSIPPTCSVKVTGDRPGGSGGAGKPLVISVSCNEAATVTVATTLQPRTARSRAADVDKKKKPKKKKKAKKVTIKLKTSTVTVQPGQAVPISLKLSSAVRKKYAGKTLTATITVTARDASANVKTTKTTRTVKLAKLKKSKAKPKKRR
jgi:sulfite reductase alpha subunit-like flavoprotein